MKIFVNKKAEFGARQMWFGEGFFTSMRVYEGKIPWINIHWQRLEECCELIFQTKLNLSPERFMESLPKLPWHGKIRVDIVSQNASRAFQLQNESELVFLVQVEEMLESDKTMSAKTEVGVNLPKWWNNKIKHNFYLPALLQKSDSNTDILWLSEDSYAREFSTSNLFLLKNRVLFTPENESSIYNGICRQQLIEKALGKKIIVEPKKICFQELITADVIIATNAVKGLRFLDKINEHQYDMNNVPDWLWELQETIFK